ncbi:MAG: peptide ABC transporter substrate-binding protein [Oscillospiraceae bacterium]|nr:peptide ABC transporter substrate-binding protein [Oscillospiraceae bacterium]
MGKRALSLLLTLFLLLSVLAGCGRVSQDFYYDIETAPVNLDPQSASDYSSQLVIASLFEGLMRVGEDGGLEPAAAERYMVSNNGLTYRFFLREDGAWSDGTPVTAHDFVYAFQRLFNPDTNAPLVSQFFCLENGEEVLAETLSPEVLGVEAEDDYTLVFRLETYNSRFLYLLTTAPAMPCSESFFTGTRGKYGLAQKTIMGNGPFYLSSWETTALRFKRNAEYRDASMTAETVRLNILDKMEDAGSIRQRFLEGRTSAAALDSLSGLEEGIHAASSENTAWGLAFNLNRAPFSEKSIRQALLYSMSLGSGESALPEGAERAKAVIPHNIRLEGRSYRESAGDNLLPERDAEQALSCWRQGLEALGETQLTGLSVIIPEGGGHETAFAYLAQVWQRDLSLYLTVEVLPAAEYQKRLASGAFDLALTSLSGAYNSPHAVLELFQSQGGGNYWGFSDSTFDALLTRAETDSNAEEALSLYRQAEQLLIEEAAFLPLYYQSEYFVMSESVTGIVYDFDSRIVSFQYGVQS